MPKISLVPIQNGTSISADAVPDEVKKDVEELWTEYQKVTGHEIRVAWDALDEKATEEDVKKLKNEVLLWLRQAVSYGKSRMDASGQSAALKIRAMPKRNLPDHIKYITIARDIPTDSAANTNQTSR